MEVNQRNDESPGSTTASSESPQRQDVNSVVNDVEATQFMDEELDLDLE